MSAHTTIRIAEQDLAEIDQQAKARSMSRTAFLVKSALKRLPEHESTLEQRLAALERRVDQAERLLDLSTNSY